MSDTEGEHSILIAAFSAGAAIGLAITASVMGLMTAPLPVIAMSIAVCVVGGGVTAFMAIRTLKLVKA